MTALSQTPANVAVGTQDVPIKSVQYGESILQGMPIYLHTDGKYYKASNQSELAAEVVAIALTPGSTNDWGIAITPSTRSGRSLVNLGATLAVGETYTLADTAGAIGPIADNGSGDFITILGVAVTTALLDFQVIISGTAKA
ncbi:MAG: hypothetical protein KDA71_17210 [Planctomycetales bacterium]|nr:hypothetical protein [Planctomycetales bacterium]